MSQDLVLQLARERDHLFLLHETGAAAERCATLEEKLRTYLSAVLRVGFLRGTISVRDEQLEQTLLVAAGLTSGEETELRRRPSSGAVWRKRLDQLETHRVSYSYYLDARDPWIAGEFGNAVPSTLPPREGGDWSPQDALVVPLRGAGGNVVGILSLDDPADRARPTVEQVRTVELYATQVAMVIERARMEEERDRQQRLSGAIADVARAVNESLQPAEVHQLIVRHARAILRCEGAVLALLDGAQLHMVAGAGKGTVLTGTRVPLTALTSRAVRTGMAVMTNEYAESADHDARVDELFPLRRVMVVPLVSRTGPIGILSAIDREAPFTDSDAEFLQRMADQVAMAVVNATLFEEVAALAERYRRVVETTRDAIVITDRRREITFTNPAADELFAIPSGSRPAAGALVPPECRAEVYERETRALAGEPQRYESAVLRADGERRLVAIANAPLYERGEVTGIVATLHDITHERDARDALARSEARYRNLFDSATDAIFTTGVDGRLTSVNRAMEKALGVERGALLGRAFVELLDLRDAPQVAVLLRETASGTRCHGQLRYQAVDGETRFGSLLATPIYEHGAVAGILGIVRDVTDERRLAEQLLQQEKLAAVGELVSGVAHELNNPLAGVVAFSELLRASHASAEQQQAIETIHAEARRAARIVANLLTFARQHQPERGLTDLNRLVDSTVELRRYSLRTLDIDVELRLDPDLPLTWADPHQLQQVVVNLVVNAEHALAERAGERRLVLETSLHQGRLQLRVADNGPGIQPDHLRRIFNPFFTTKGVGRGTGLGLSISHGIVREHDGRIQVESTPGSGACFTVELPWVAPPSAPAQLSPAATDAVPGKRVLVVDDEASIRAAVSRYLQSLGYVVESAACGEEVLVLVEQREYDAILLDVRMPGIQGDAVYRQLHAVRPGQATRIVFATGDLPGDGVRRSLEATGRPVLMKPFLLDDLGAIVASTVRASRPGAP